MIESTSDIETFVEIRKDIQGRNEKEAAFPHR